MSATAKSSNPGHSGHFAPFEFELYGGLSPTNNDTDGDGLYDGQNVSASDSLDGKDHTGELSIGTEQLNPDTDGDSITDGQEINGYELTWMEPKDDGPIQHGPNTYTSDPTDATNNWRDLDQDGISDYNETHYSEAYDWLVSWAKQKSDDYNKSD